MSETQNESMALVERLLGSLISGLELLTVHVGVDHGLYRALADRPGATEAEVASRTGVAPRYVREWLEQQAAASFILCDNPSADAPARTYRLADGAHEVLLQPEHPLAGAALAHCMAGVARALPLLADAYRTGGGVPYAAFGTEIRAGIAGMNRPGFVNSLGQEWIPAMPDVDARLHAGPAARVLDLGCGTGVSSLAIAAAYPRTRVIGVDLDGPSIAEARAGAVRAGLGDRVSFVEGDAAGLAAEGPFELVTIFEALHDMGDPVGALRTARALLAPDGVLLVADERVADTFAGPADEVERLQYAFSVLHCLPATMAESPVEAAGTALRAPTVARWAGDAGFARCETLPIEHDFWRFYRLG
jgi:SAM-dependent methyltransferase